MDEPLDCLLLCIATYVFMRAFEVEFASCRERRWYRVAVRLIAGITLVSAGIAFVAILADGMQGIRITSKKTPPTVVQSVDADRLPKVATNGAIREHVVEQGEDLYTVAMMYGVSVKELKAANGLTDTVVAPGTRIRIPATRVEEQEPNSQ